MQIDNEILIIDDNISQLKLLDKILSQAQYPVRIASNSHQALRSIAHKPPALILLDIMMPDIDGLEICRRLNAEPSTRNIPVIFISGLEDADTKVKGFNAGAVDYITKPFQTAEILARVKTHLRLRHLQTNLEQAYAEMEERVLERTGELFQTNQALRISEQRYRSLFENTPISILEEDFSEVKIYLDELKRNGINDIETYLADHMDEVKRIRSLVKLIDTNRADLEFQGIDNKCILIKHIMECFTEETFKDYLKVFLAIWNGIQQIGFETVMKILTGEKRYISVRWSVLPGYEKTLRRVLVSVVDITNLKRSKQALQASKQQLEHSLHEKDILLQEIYHRTKNNMQVIISLLTLQSAHIRDPETLHIFRETKNRIRSMALVHKKLCQSRNLSKIDLKYYITDLTTALLKSYHASPDKISLKIDAKNVFLSIDTAVSCGLVVNELFSNALLHAFPGNCKGEIRICLSQCPDGKIQLCLADNGIGLPEGFDIRQAESLGLQLIASLVEEQLQGQLEVIRNRGVEFLITFTESRQPNQARVSQVSV